VPRATATLLEAPRARLGVPRATAALLEAPRVRLGVPRAMAAPLEAPRARLGVPRADRRVDETSVRRPSHMELARVVLARHLTPVGVGLRLRTKSQA
jgi:hypothetical protein